MRLFILGLLCCIWGEVAVGQFPCSGGVADNTYPCNEIDLQSFLPLSGLSLPTMTAVNTNDIWGWTDPLTGKEYAIVGLRNGTAFVDISTPTSPVLIGHLATHSGESLWRDIKVHNNHAFIVSESTNHGMQIFDLTFLRLVTVPPVILTETEHLDFGNLSRAHNIVLNEETGYAYPVGTIQFCSGGVTYIDVNDPVNPSIEGCFDGDGYTHDAICVIYRGPDADYIGQEICIGFNADTYTIIDVTDKSDGTMISRNPYAEHAYTHQGWITDDHKYLLLDDEIDESRFGRNTRTLIFDISDLENPIPLGFHQHNTPATDHNLYVRGRYAFLSNYRSGVRVLDLCDIANNNLTEVAYFDTYPATNAVGYAGSWSNYPYFKSGNIVATGIEEGLFVLKPNFPHFTFTLDYPSVQTLTPGQNTTFELDLTRYSNFAERVNISILNEPDDLSITFNNTTVPPNGQITITVTAAADAITNNYSIILYGQGDDVSSKQTIAFGVKVDGLPIQIAPKILLQGPFLSTNGLMNDDLRQQGLIPTTEPYGGTLQNPGISTTPTVLNVTGNDAIVDWVIVELRKDPESVFIARAALLQRDGDIVDVDGTSPVSFPSIIAGEYHVVIRHRNHLSVMTGNPVLFE